MFRSELLSIPNRLAYSKKSFDADFTDYYDFLCLLAIDFGLCYSLSVTKRKKMKLKQVIGIPLLLIFLWILGGRLIENLSNTGGTPMIVLAVLIILIILMLSFRQLRY